MLNNKKSVFILFVCIALVLSLISCDKVKEKYDNLPQISADPNSDAVQKKEKVDIKPLEITEVGDVTGNFNPVTNYSGSGDHITIKAGEYEVLEKEPNNWSNLLEEGQFATIERDYNVNVFHKFYIGKRQVMIINNISLEDIEISRDKCFFLIIEKDK